MNVVSEPTTDKILAEYDANLHSYEEFRRISETLISQLLRHEGFRVHSVTSRLKTRLSLAGKLKREGKRYGALSDLTDVVGIRVITHFEDEVDRIGSLIEREFRIDFDKSIDKRRILDPDRFGYLSLHYICGLTPARLELTENRSCHGLLCEIQVRSILQHAWAEIEHDLGYKAGAELPSHIRRRFSRLAGMLEIADAEFSRLRGDIESYATEVAANIERGTSAVPIDAISLGTLLEKDPVIRSFDEHLAAILNVPLKASVNRSGFANELRLVGISTLQDLHAALESRRALVIEYWKAVTKDSPHFEVPHGVSLWQLFQVMLGERGLSAATKICEEAGINLQFARTVIRFFKTVKRSKLPKQPITKRSPAKKKRLSPKKQ